MALDGQTDSSSVQSQPADSSATVTATPGQTTEGAAPSASPPQDAKQPAESSTAAGAKEDPKKSLRDVVKDVVSKGTETSPGSKTGSEAKPDASAEGAKPQDGDKDEALPFHNHPRWKEQLRKERELTQQVETYKGDAEQFGRITEFMKVSNLVPTEVAEGFEVMALMKNDPKKAKERLQEYLHRINLHLGEELAPDLQEQVKIGALNDTAAKELQLARNATEAAKAREAERDQQAKADGFRRQVEGCASAVTAWEQSVKARDPDFAVKQPMLSDRYQALVAQRGLPRTPDAAVALAKEALADVEKAMKPILTRTKTATSPTPSQSAAVTEQPRPKNLREAVERGMRQGAP